MAQFSTRYAGWILLMLLSIAAADTVPPEIAENPSHATCKIAKYKHCYNLVLVCPKSCPNSCTVECASCKPICGPESPDFGPTIRLLEEDDKGGKGKGDDDNEGGKNKGKGDDNNEGEKNKGKGGKDDKGEKNKGKGDDDNENEGDKNKGKGGKDDKGGDNDDKEKKDKDKPNYPPPTTPTQPPPTTNPPPITPTYPPPTTPTQPPPTTNPSPSTPTNPSPSTTPTQPPATTKPPPTIPTNPPPTTPTQPPPTTNPPPITPTYPPPTTPTQPPPTTNPPPTIPTQPPPTTNPSPTNPAQSPPTTNPPTTPPSPSPSTPTPSTPSPSEEYGAGVKRVRCKNKNYPQCYDVQHTCPTACPSGCQVDCVTCKPVCSCDMPGAICQDPRFIGADGITFYFHGKKDKDFCLVSDPNLHINAHFIGRRNENMKRDFTWVQSIGILFDNHKLFIGAQKTAQWDDAVDRLSIAFDEESIVLPNTDDARWQSETLPMASITRTSDTNSVLIEVEGLFKITAKVVPITEKESRVHNYGITKDDCFAHLELGFKFFSLSDEVNGVLGQTYARNYVSRAKMGIAMPVLGGDKQFGASSLFAADCSVAKFQGGKTFEYKAASLSSDLPSLKCSSGLDGRGVVCKR